MSTKEVSARILSLSPQPSHISDRRSPYFRTHTPLSTYESSHETVLHHDCNSPTIAETHFISNEGVLDESFCEEHCSSEVENFVTLSPPKFLQSIEQSKDLTNERFILNVKVCSEPPATFEWSFNDELVQGDLACFSIKNRVNESTLIVYFPQEVSAQNPVGISRASYHLKTGNSIEKATKTTRSENMQLNEFGEVFDERAVNDPLQRISSPTSSVLSSSSSKMIRRGSTSSHLLPMKPIFLQVPSLTQTLSLGPNQPLVANVNLKAVPVAQIHWFWNNFQLKSSDLISITFPAPNSSTLTHREPPSGVYKVLATNMHGSATYSMRVTSSGVDVGTRFMKRGSESSENEKTELISERRRGSKGIRDDFPRAPTILNNFKPINHVRNGDPIVFEVRVDAEPEANFLWLQNNFELKNGQTNVKIDAIERNASRLTLAKPVDGKIDLMAFNSIGRSSQSTRLVINYSADDRQIKTATRSAVAFSRLLPAELKIDSSSIDVEVRANQPEGSTYSVEFVNPSGTIRSQCTIPLEQTTKIPPTVPQKRYKIRDGLVTPIDQPKQHHIAVLKVDRRAEDFNETANLQKEEEKYALLIKVADALAEKLVVNIFVDAVQEAAHRLSLLVPSSEEESEEEEDSVSVIDMSQREVLQNEVTFVEVKIDAKESRQDMEVVIAEDVFEEISFTISQDIEINAVLCLTSKTAELRAAVVEVKSETKRQPPPVPPRRNSKTGQIRMVSTNEHPESDNSQIELIENKTIIEHSLDKIEASEVKTDVNLRRQEDSFVDLSKLSQDISIIEGQQKDEESLKETSQIKQPLELINYELEHSDASESAQSTSVGISLAQNEFSFTRDVLSNNSTSELIDSGICVRSTDSVPSAAQPTNKNAIQAATIIGTSLVDALLGKAEHKSSQEETQMSNLSQSVWAEVLSQVEGKEARRPKNKCDTQPKTTESPTHLALTGQSRSTGSTARFRHRAMDGLKRLYEKNIGGKLKRIQERGRNFSRSAHRSHSSQPPPLNSNPDSNVFQYSTGNTDYTSTRFYDAEFVPNRNGHFLHNTSSEPAEYFYQTTPLQSNVASTETIRRFEIPENPPSPVRRYVDALFNLNDLMDWRAIDEGIRERRAAAIQEALPDLVEREQRRIWHESQQKQQPLLFPSNELSVDIELEDEMSRINLRTPQIEDQNKLLKRIESPRPGRLHGRVFPLDGKNSPAPYLLRTNSTCRASRITDITQEWSLLKEPQHGRIEAYFYPFERVRTNCQLQEPQKSKISQLKSTKNSHLHDDRSVIDRETQTTPSIPLFVIQHTTYLDGRLFSVDQQQQRVYQIDEKIGMSNLTLQDRQFSTLPTNISQRRDNIQADLVNRTIREIENEAGVVRQHFRKTVSEDALRIEKTIFEVSEALAKQGPCSRAQALASEELLRTRIAEAILNMNPTEELFRTPTIQLKNDKLTNVQQPTIQPQPTSEDALEKVDLLRQPINTLKSKLQQLHDRLINDEEREIREELKQINSMRSDGSDKQELVEREDEVKRRSDNILRMTPIVLAARNKLASLDQAVDRKAVAMNSTSVSSRQRVRNRTATPPPFDNTRSIHRLLSNIGDEIAEMHDLCRTNRQIDSVNLVVGVLNRVCSSIDGILNAFKNEEADELSEVSTSLSASAQSGAVETVAVNLQRREQAEETNTLLMFWNGADEAPTLSTQLDARVQAPPQASITKATVRVYEFAHVALRLRSIQKEKAKINQPATEVPQIQLVAPPLAARHSEVRTEVAVQLRHKPEHRKAEALMGNDFHPKLKSAHVKTNAEITPKKKAKEAEAAVVRRKNAEPLQSAINPAAQQPTVETSMLRSLDDEVSEANDIPILFARRNSVTTPSTLRETAILSSDDEELLNLQVMNVRNSCVETFKLKKHRRNYKVNAFVYPAVWGRIAARVSENDWQVDVDVESDSWRDSVVVLTSESWTTTEAFITGKFDPADTSIERDWTIQDAMEISTTNSRLSISINARSMNDNVAALLEEVLWSEVSLTIPQELQLDRFSEAQRNSGSFNLFNVTVSENHDEAKSAKSQCSSHRSSQKSLAISEQFSQQSVDVPTYIIKQGSTASITCELNSFVPRHAKIEWWRGRQHVAQIGSKYSRVREEYLEVLVINNVQPIDSELYSITVDREIYPVAYLIVEDNSPMKETQHFSSPTQTVFVMENQTAILSCQLVSSIAPTWFYNDEPLEFDGRFKFQREENGWNRVIIENVKMEDAGTYYAIADDAMASISLVVEEFISEKEVQVSNAETEDEDLADYLVPPGSTATIACELESANFLEELVWQKNAKPIRLSGQNKFEHVVNGARHYLVIHQAQVEDSGVYSVVINGLVFKVAQITIAEGLSLSGSRIKQISTSSVCI
ncbi:Immunoglobulin domain protein [Aphelenchoides besseyi]|nr:Immunoglobulin domain protein [Aphelenchoides besseyi]